MKTKGFLRHQKNGHLLYSPVGKAEVRGGAWGGSKQKSQQKEYFHTSMFAINWRFKIDGLASLMCRRTSPLVFATNASVSLALK